MQPNWFDTDEREDVLGSLRQALRMTNYVKEDSQAWKWFAIAIHSGLQGACICHLTTSAPPIGAIRDGDVKIWLDYFEKSRSDPNISYPKTKLLPLPDLLKRVREIGSSGDCIQTSKIDISDFEMECLIAFHNNIRNPFVHFEPKIWSIETSGLPFIAVLSARIIQDIFEYGYGFRHLTDEAKNELQDLLRRLTDLPQPQP